MTNTPPQKTSVTILSILALLFLSPRLQAANEVEAHTEPHPSFPIYRSSEEPSVVASAEACANSTSWEITDYRGGIKASGTFQATQKANSGARKIQLPNIGAGYFEFHIIGPNRSKILPAKGSRPSGYIAYGILSDIPRNEIISSPSRFGLQGTAYIASGQVGKGDYVNPFYTSLGVKWSYFSRRPWDLYPTSPDDYAARLTPSDFVNENSYESRNHINILTDISSIPRWLLPSLQPSDGRASANEGGQAYIPTNLKLYSKIITTLAAEQAVRRKVLFPTQKRSYYVIQWEPDWHYKGSPEEAVEMYRTASTAIHRSDPTGILLGANFGVIRRGNSLLERLLKAGLGRYLDGIATHLYALETADPEKAGLVQDLRTLVRLTREYLPKDAPIWNTEWGVDWGTKGPNVDENALFLEMHRTIRGHVIALGEHVDTTFLFYVSDTSLKNGGGLTFNTSGKEPWFGATQVEPKPVFLAAAVMIRLLEGSTTIGAAQGPVSACVRYRFATRDGPVECVWSDDGKEYGITVESRDKFLSVYDPMGNQLTKSPDGKACVIAISPAPIWIKSKTEVSLKLTSM